MRDPRAPDRKGVPAAALLVLALLALGGCKGTVRQPVVAPDWPPIEVEKPLTRHRAVELALAWAPNRTAWRARWLTARAAVQEAGLLPNPRLSLSWEDFGLGAAGSVPQWTLSIAAALEGIAARPARTKAARHELEAERANLLAERMRLAAGVEGAYDDLVVKRLRVSLAHEVEDLADRERAGLAELVHVGERAAFDLERSEAEAASARMEVTRAEGEANQAELAFAFSLGFGAPLHLELADGLRPVGEETQDLVDLLALAAKRRPELRAACESYRAALARARLEASRIRFLPEVGAGPRLTDGDWLGVASLDVELPVFDTGRASSALARADVLAQAARIRQVAHEVAGDVSAASMEVEQARRLLNEHALDLVGRREALLEKTKQLYGAGEATYSDLLQARRDVITARETALEARRDVARAQVSLAAATGTLAIN